MKKSKKKLSFLSALTLALLFLPAAFALEVPEKPLGRVTDLTGTLSRNEVLTLDQKLLHYQQETTNQIAVLLIPSLQGDSLEDYSIRLAGKWKIGEKGKDNGVILLIVKNDRKLRIEVGYGLEGALPDSLAGSIIRNEIAPRFQQGQFYQGIDAGVEAVIAATRGEYRAAREKKKGSSGLPLWVQILIIAFWLFFPAIYWRRNRHYYSGRSGGWATGGGFFRGGSRGDFSGGFSGGGGGFGGGGASGGW